MPSSHSQKRRRRQQSFVEYNRVYLLIPFTLAVLAISHQVLRLYRSIIAQRSPSAAAAASASLAIPYLSKYGGDHPDYANWWNYDWCSRWEQCQYHLPLDLNEFLPPVNEPSFLDVGIPNVEDIANFIHLDDEGNAASVSSSKVPMTDDLDNHFDRLGNMLMEAPSFTYPPTPPILSEARRNITLGRTNHTEKEQEHLKPSPYFALLTRRGLGQSHMYNQDRVVLVDPFPPMLTKKQARSLRSHPLHNNFFMGIFDGHDDKGHIKADFAATSLPYYLLERLSKLNPEKTSYPRAVLEQQIREAMEASFLEAHEEGPTVGGCTASIVVRLQRHLYYANAGDSRSYLLQVNTATGNTTVVFATKPHKPNDPVERQRIEKTGCIVIEPTFHDNTARVAASDEDALALAMSRSLGDFDLKHCGVIAIPTIDVIDLDQQDTPAEVVLLAVSVTDGILDYVPIEEISQGLAAPFLSKGAYFDSEASPLELAAEKLIRTASDRWLNSTSFFPYRDDITLAVRRVQ